MMKKKIFPFFVLLTLFISCSDAPLLIENQILDQNAIVECEDKPCPQVTVDYLKYSGEQEVIKPINTKIEQFIIESLYLGDPEVKTTAISAQEAIAGFIKDYWRDTSEFPDIHEYEAEVSIEETFRSKEIASIALSQYKYTGGAHGNGSLAYINFDIETGEIITNDLLIKDLGGLTAFAEKQLREDSGLSDLDNINAKRYWFANETFYISEDIGFENQKMIIHYNQYEIASYADGPIDIELSLDDVVAFLNYSLDKK